MSLINEFNQYSLDDAFLKSYAYYILTGANYGGRFTTEDRMSTLLFTQFASLNQYVVLPQFGVPGCKSKNCFVDIVLMPAADIFRSSKHLIAIEAKHFSPNQRLNSDSYLKNSIAGLRSDQNKLRDMSQFSEKYLISFQTQVTSLNLHEREASYNALKLDFPFLKSYIGDSIDKAQINISKTNQSDHLESLRMTLSEEFNHRIITKTSSCKVDHTLATIGLNIFCALIPLDNINC